MSPAKQQTIFMMYDYAVSIMQIDQIIYLTVMCITLYGLSAVSLSILGLIIGSN